ncbi:sensor domain-containing protein [Bacillus salinus]|uniref:sensor domain-containing protein n=1 Tax=Bacillus sp. HMF5848 TaxID=2495421 RepID=UPI00163AB20F|nr:EAL domain-containing protein [Bacillus sp. HMF5848]
MLASSSDSLKDILFDIVLTYIDDLVFVMKVESDESFTYLYMNEKAYKKAGVSTEAIGKCMKDVLSIKVANDLETYYKEVLCNKKSIRFIDTSKSETGQSQYEESILTPVISNTGKVTHIVSVTRDITDKIIEKRKLEESEQRYKSLYDHNLDAIFSFDKSGIFQGFNPPFSHITGYKTGMLKLSIYEFISEEDYNKINNLMTDIFNGKSAETVCRALHKSGHKIYLHLKAVPIVVKGNVQGAYGIARDITEQLSKEEMIRFMAYHDQVTGLRNRISLKDYLHNAVEEAKRFNSQVAVIYFDLDRFKKVNDTMGHYAGDELLQQVARRLELIENEKLALFRLSGDEFIAIVTDSSLDEIKLCAEKILACFRSPFFLKRSVEYYITASLGISLYPSDGEEPQILINNADTAMYRVKDCGRAHYQFYSLEMYKASKREVQLEAALRKAIENKEFTLYYQPRINMITNTVTSYEALLRWSSHQLGFISPADFIPLAEDSGLIIPIGEWVINEACRQLKECLQKKSNAKPIAVNLSAKQFQQDNLVDMIESMVRKYNVPPELLEVEITETVLHNTERTLLTLERLAAFGVTISIDDFGTGYSSLSYLRKFPIHSLKIDRSFIKGITTNEKDAAITTTIIHLGNSLGLEVIAEGVETKQQVDFLLKNHCIKAQGFYYSKPKPFKK